MALVALAFFIILAWLLGNAFVDALRAGDWFLVVLTGLGTLFCIFFPALFVYELATGEI